jgi:hypothetical protein
LRLDARVDMLRARIRAGAVATRYTRVQKSVNVWITAQSANHHVRLCYPIFLCVTSVIIVLYSMGRTFGGYHR